MRSNWKGLFIFYGVYYSYFFSSKKKHYFITNRSSTIISKFSNSLFLIYTGTHWVQLKIFDLLEGQKFGEFAFTKEVVKHIVKKNKKT